MEIRPRHETSGAVFFLAGALVTISSVVSALSRERLREQRNYLVVDSLALGRSRHPQRLHKREVKEIEVTAARTVSGRQEVAVRSERKILRLGRHLDVDGRAWLKRYLRQLVSSLV